MARPRNPARDESKKIWLDSGGKAELKTIAERLGVSPNQVRKWKSTDKWAADLNGNVTKPQKERYHSMKGNRNADGNQGNLHASPPIRNQNAMIHGLFSKYLPTETGEIMDAVSDRDPVDLIWDQIQLQYAAIIRAQKIMYVADADDLSHKQSAYSEGEVASGETFALQYAWDKQANFLAAQSRAMGTLSNLIKQFTAMADEKDERAKKIAVMEESIKKAKAEATIAEYRADQLTKGKDSTEQQVGKLMDKILDDVEGEAHDGIVSDIHAEADPGDSGVQNS